jgi:diguanylate cyclase (GGDEF)-like protein
MPRRLPQPIEEFFRAIQNPYSYNISKNIYIWFGLLWGLPIPLVTGFLETHIYSSVGIEKQFLEVLTSPIQLFFLAHPPVFAIIFGILGTIRFEKDKELAKTIGQLRDMTIHDPLTGLKNRRYFAHIFHDECARSQRNNEPMSLLFLDIDHFKQVNDQHGHHIGDEVLIQLGDYLMRHCRPYDTAVRWGGEEFLLLLSSVDEQSAAQFADRLRKGVEVELSNKFNFPITVSIGLAQYQQDDTLELITDRADQALYHAKATGRNRVVTWSKLQDDSYHNTSY